MSTVGEEASPALSRRVSTCLVSGLWRDQARNATEPLSPHRPVGTRGHGRARFCYRSSEAWISREHSHSCVVVGVQVGVRALLAPLPIRSLACYQEGKLRARLPLCLEGFLLQDLRKERRQYSQTVPLRHSTARKKAAATRRVAGQAHCTVPRVSQAQPMAHPQPRKV
jgi:hypothetical protein